VFNAVVDVKMLGCD